MAEMEQAADSALAGQSYFRERNIWREVAQSTRVALDTTSAALARAQVDVEMSALNENALKWQNQKLLRDLTTCTKKQTSLWSQLKRYGTIGIAALLGYEACRITSQ